ncbi:MAG TPA: D-aminoacyl-tRNA deacylase [Fimbriimonadaceae bacterium]|nr:D-aminoacyl-tRNA deacylase [Fimbriimonadaceae bacterium]
MRAVVQRVSRASVTVDGEVVGRCGQGLLVLVAAHRDDTEREAAKLADRVAKLRIFNDGEGKMNLALGDLVPPGSVLAVSNFTVYGETAKNRRPSFIESAPYEAGKELYESFLAALRGMGIHVETGIFGAHMDVELVNDGPVTVIVEG